MSIDIGAAEQFLLANARLLDRHRAAVLLHGAPVEPVLSTLRGYRNADGGFGHALEPDVRSPFSEPTAALHGLEVLAEIGRLGEAMAADALRWLAGIALPDGGLPFVLATAADYPRGPWMVAGAGGSHLTFAVAALATEAGSQLPWTAQAVQWCWRQLEAPDALTGYWAKYALIFLDGAADPERARVAVERLRGLLGADGSLAVPGGTADERLTALDLAPRPGAVSRRLFTDAQVAAGLDALERAQAEDGGWTFDWLAWSPGQSAEWRGIVTLRALLTLRANGRC